MLWPSRARLLLLPAAALACGADKPDGGDGDPGNTAEFIDGSGGGGDGDGGQGGVPDISLSPLEHDFGTVGEGETASQVFTVRNDGGGQLELASIALAEADGPFVLTLPEGMTVEAGASVDFVVDFAPTVAGEFLDTVVIDSNDPDEATVEVLLMGRGGLPAVELSPTTYDFGSVWIGCDSEQLFTVENVGTAPLELSALTGSGDEELVLGLNTPSNGPLPWTLMPGELRQLVVAYAPLQEGRHTLDLELVSTDPSQPVAQATVEGRAELWGEQTDQFAFEGSGGSSVELSAYPVPATLEVALNGTDLSAGWSYNPSTNAVDFVSTISLGSGDRVEVRYALFGDCDS